VTPISLRPVILKTAQDRNSVTMGYLHEMAYAVSNGHMSDEVM